MKDLRPTRFDDIIGQTDAKTCLQILVDSARKRGDVLGHILLDGGPGLGKTTFARAIANEVDSKIYLANGGTMRKGKDVLPYLARLRRGDILFIDEVHRIPKQLQESLFTVMEDFRYDLAKGAKSIEFEPFTMIGATTEAGTLLRPFIDRFVNYIHLEPYSVHEIAEILKINAQKIGTGLHPDAIENIARRSRSTPRIANNYLRWVRDFAVAAGVSSIDTMHVNNAMKLRGVEEDGIDRNDRAYLNVLKRAGKPVGLNTIVSTMGIDRPTVEGIIEPFLLRKGLIAKTSRGRELV